jgi:hypothetical protein
LSRLAFALKLDNLLCGFALELIEDSQALFERLCGYTALSGAKPKHRFHGEPR